MLKNETHHFKERIKKDLKRSIKITKEFKEEFKFKVWAYYWVGYLDCLIDYEKLNIEELHSLKEWLISLDKNNLSYKRESLKK